MKKIGILGGMSSASTSEYYKIINKQVQEKLGGHNTPELIIYSVNFEVITECVKNNNWEDAGQYLGEIAKALQHAGADAIALATNTLHKVRNHILKEIDVPFIDIIDSISSKIRSDEKNKISILGTYPTMTDPFYIDAYRENSIELLAPKESDKIEINRIIFEELTFNVIKESSKKFFLQVLEDSFDRGAEGVILGCTELKLILKQEDFKKLCFYDSLHLHCEEIVQLACST
tara:strand:+ start:2114 stop:2809 length:696 start_codon:yes stop_codon:yes gene_type:complete